MKKVKKSTFLPQLFKLSLKYYFMKEINWVNIQILYKNNKKIQKHISIIIISLPKFPEINLSMAQSTKFKISFLDLGLIHFMSASFTSVIISGGDRFSADNTGREITAAASACSIVFTY